VPWVRLDDQFAEHPKVMRAGPLAMAMHVAGLCYAARNLTDGIVPRSAAKRLIDLDDFDVSWSEVLADLLAAGIWTEADDGYEIHDYLEYQPSKAEVEEKRADLHAKRSAAGQKGARARWDKPPAQDGKHGKPDSKPKAKAMADEWQDDGPVPVPDIEPLTTFEVARVPDDGSTLNDLKAVLVELCGEPPPKQWSLLNRVATWIRDNDGTAGEVRYKASRIAQEWGVKAVTVASIEKHWTRYDAEVGQLTDADVKRYQSELRRERQRREILDAT
jgi:hypothetical protein